MADIPSTRGQKEVIDGKTVDMHGVHINDNFLEAALLKAGKGESVSSDEDAEGVEDVKDHDITEGEVEKDNEFVIDKNGCHLDKDSLLSRITSFASVPQMKMSASKDKTAKTAKVDFGIYNPILEELVKIPLSEETYETDMETLRGAIRTAAKELKVRRIVANTKAIAKNAQNFYQSEEGMRVVFSILGNKFSMSVKGELTGMEAFYIQVNSDSLEGIVLQKSPNGDFADATESFDIQIKKVN
jgi:hypothetical protein